LAPELETLHHGAATDTVKRAMRAYHSGAARRTFDQLHPGVIDPVASGGGWWGKLVGAVASRTNEESTEQLANFTDSAIGVLPVPFATKLVALNVEAASLSGYCHSEQVNARF
jgi:glycosyltransferase, group 2 family protein